MNIPDIQLITLRLEAVRLANGDLTLAQSILDFLTAPSSAELVAEQAQAAKDANVNTVVSIA